MTSAPQIAATRVYSGIHNSEQTTTDIGTPFRLKRGGPLSPGATHTFVSLKGSVAVCALG